MSGTITPGGPVDFYNRCTHIARRAGALTVVDAQGAVLIESLPARPGLVKPNRAELATTVGRKLPTQSAVTRAMPELHNPTAVRQCATARNDPALAFGCPQCWSLLSPAASHTTPVRPGAPLAWALVSQ